MRICLIQDILPFHSQGGAQFMGWHTAVELVRRGHHVTVVGAGVDTPPASPVDGVHCHFISSVLPGSSRYHERFAHEALDRFARGKQESFDIIQVRGWRTAGFAGRICRRNRFRIPVVGHTAGLGFAYEFETRARLLAQEETGSALAASRKLWARRRYYLQHTFPLERAVRYLDGFSTVTFRGLRLARLLYQIPKRRLYLINDGVPADAFMPPDRSPDTHTFLFVGSLVRRKGVDLAIQALSDVAVRSPSVCLRVVGDGPERAALSHRAAELGVADRVDFVGRVPNVDIPKQMRDCFALVNPTLSTVGYETVQIEAMLCERIVIAPATPSNRMLISHGREGLLFRPRSGASLAAAMHRLVHMPEDVRASIGRRARDVALRHFTTARMAEMTETALQSALNMSHQRRPVTPPIGPFL
jgi:glycosyltransferase involved in cell wall biosynthesis